MRALSAHAERWPVRGTFRIARGARSEVQVVVAEIRDGSAVGRGECVPYARYGERVESVLAQIASVRAALAAGAGRDALQDLLPAGAARNALDCALWDLDAKRAGTSAWRLAGLAPPAPLTTAFTLSLDEPAAMARAARQAADRPLLKLKLGGDGDLERVRAVRASAPGARLVVDANESWTEAHYTRFAPALADLGVELIEQPLPAGSDAALARLDRPVAVCADESCHDTASLPALAGRYDCVNVKLDKAGGLTEALRLRRAAAAAGLDVMVGCMVGTSLAMAPACLVAQGVRYVDLDGPLLLARDRVPGLAYAASVVSPPTPALWG